MRATSLHLLAALASLTASAEIDTEGLPDTGLDTSQWVTGEVPPLDDMVNLHDMQLAAKNALSGKNYAYYRTASLDEVTYKKNLFDWEKIRLNGFSFVNVSNINLQTSILGHEFSAPFFIAPAAKAGKASKGAETNLVRAAGAAGILYIPSISSTLSIEEISDAALPSGNSTSSNSTSSSTTPQVLFHQEYIWTNTTRLTSELRRMENSGYKALVLTVDNVGVNGIRNRQMRYSSGLSETLHSATFTIESLAQLRNMTTLPIIPKGVKTAHDVKLCADLGFPAVYISNHGGRTVDLAPTAVETLLEVRRLYPEVFDQVEIYADGGVRRASHILTLIALGAKAVGVGRPAMFANVFGEEGVSKMIAILKEELKTTMQLMGESDVNAYRGNGTFVNTKAVERDFFGLA